jgi:hypothetical protein
MANDPSSGSGRNPRPGAGAADPGAAVQAARQGLLSARQQLADLAHMLGRLSEVSGSLRPVIDRLSEMTVNTAAEMARAGGVGLPLVPVVSQLGAIAGLSAIALGELEGCLRHSISAVQAVTGQAELSTAELDRVLPALEAAAAASAARPPAVPPPTPPAATAEPVALELRVAAASAKASGQQKQSPLDIWPTTRRRRDEVN